ncbi:MAG: fimbrillin family protein [Dysgonomonas sp.]|uniref:fimbrillin family protein n=1 Tax=Dysgonomonas sp. TaxID=1891233 RepID=UPI0039E58930
MKRRLLLLLLPALLLAGCNNDEETAPPDFPEGRSGITFKMGFAGEDDLATRAATAPNFKTTWEVGDEIGLFIVRGASGLQPSGNYADNMKLIRQIDGSWQPQSPIYYPNLTDQLHFYAYYPYDGTMTNPTNHTYSVKADQSLESDYNKSDLLLAKTENVSKSSNAVQLQFSHALSLVQVEVTREINISPFTDDLTLTLINAKSDAVLGWGSALTGIGTSTNITMHKVESLDYTYRALVPAQTLNADTKVSFMQTTTGKKINMTYLGIASSALAAKKVHKHSVTLGYGINPDHAYAVGDVYPHIGPAVGIVYTISDGGKHGKVLGLDEGTGLNWNDWAGNNGASNMTNGIPNMKAMYDITSGGGWRPFQAYEWVHNHNNSAETYSDSYAKGVWYLPAKDELSALYLAYDTFGKTAFNNRLTTARGTELGNNWYWSSSEYDDNSAWLVMLGSGNTSYVNKTNTTYITRFFLAF